MRRPLWPDVPIPAPKRPDPDAEMKAVMFGRLCREDIVRALVAGYEHRTADERATFRDQDLDAAVGLAVRAGHYGRLALEQRRADRLRREAEDLLRAIRRTA